MRINAYLARAGVPSRRKADELIKQGRVKINGNPAMLNTAVSDTDKVYLDGREVKLQQLTYILLNKPAGVVTTVRDTHGRRTVVDLVKTEQKLVPVGRLDKDTTGALLLTNDGELAHRLMHPRYEVTKIYLATVYGDITKQKLEQLSKGVVLDDGLTAPATVNQIAADKAELAIHEGRKHQVKRMLAAVNLPVIQLHRSNYAGLSADELKTGEWRGLTTQEIKRLKMIQ